MKTKIKRLKGVKDLTMRMQGIAEFRVTGRDPKTGERFSTVVTGTRTDAEREASLLARGS